MAVNLELYRIFCSVARAGSMTQASRELYISQPAVTQAIKQLEKELGGSLFIRSSRGIALTREGELLFKHVEPALEQLRGGEKRFSEMLNLERGYINIGASDSICKFYLLNYLEIFHERYPNLEIHVTNRITRETIQLLKNGDVDIGFVNLPVEDDPQLAVIPCKAIMTASSPDRSISTRSRKSEALRRSQNIHCFCWRRPATQGRGSTSISWRKTYR